MAKTSKPCPGCKKEAPKGFMNKPVRWRDAEGVCEECEQKLAEYPTLKRQLSRALGRKKGGKGYVDISAPFAPHAIEFPYHCPGHKCGHIEVLKDEFWELLYLVSWENSHKDWQGDRTKESRTIERDVLKRLIRLVKAISWYGEWCYQAGVLNGRNLLMRLASGEDGVETYNSRVEQEDDQFERMMEHKHLSQCSLGASYYGEEFTEEELHVVPVEDV